MKNQPWKLLGLSLFVATFTLATESARATNTWDGGGGDGNWSTAANWGSDTLPTAPTGLQFAGLLQLTANNDYFASNTVINGLTFSSTAGAFTLTGNAITLGSASGISNLSSNTQTVAMNMVLEGASTHSLSARVNGALNISGNISGDTGLSLSSASGVGVITLSGNNTYTGTTVQNSNAQLNINSNTALGSSLLVTGSAVIDNTSGSAVTINNNIYLSTATFAGTNALSILGTVTLGNYLGSGRNFNVNGTAPVTFGNVVNGDATTNPTTGFGKQGTGTLVFAGANSFTGGLTVSDGTLRLANANAAMTGNAFTLALDASAKLQLNGNNAMIGTLSGLLNVAGAVAGGGIIENGSTTDSTLYIKGGNSNGNTYFAGTIRDGGTGKVNVVKNATSSTATITNIIGTQTYTGTTTVNGGTLMTDSSYASAANTSTAAGTISNIISPNSALVMGGGTFQIKGRRAGTATSVATNAAYVSGTTSIPTTSALAGTVAPGQLISGPGIPAGAYVLYVSTSGGNGTIVISAPTTAAGASGATLTFANTTGIQSVSQTFNGITVNSGASVVDAAGASATLGSSLIDLRGTGGSALATRNAGGTVDFRATSGTYGTAANQGIVKANFANSNGVLGAWATVGSGGNLATNDGSGNIVAYGAYTNINAQSSTITSGASTNVAITAGGTAGTNIALSAALTDINTLTDKANTAAAIVETAGKTLRFGALGGVLMTSTSSTLTLGNAVNDGFVTSGGVDNTAGELILNNNSSAALTVNAVIANNGTGEVTLTKSGNGALNLNGANTYTGATYLNGGTTTITSNGNLGLASAGSALYMNSATLSLAGANSVALDNGGANKRNVVIKGFGATLDVADAAGNLLVSGVMSSSDVGAGGLSKTGLGTLTLTGNNTMSGGVIVNAGTLAIGSNAALGTGELGLTNGSRLTSMDTSARTISNQLSDFVSGTATINFGKAAETTGNLTFSNTTTVYLSGNAVSAKTFNVSNTRVTFNNGFAEARGYNSPTGAPATSLTKDGNGTMVLNGVSTYSGGTTITAGTLVINAASSVINPTNPSTLFTGSSTGTGTVTIATGATLAGTGTALGAVTALGATSVISPGDNSIGILTLSGGLSAASGATFAMTLGGVGSSDQINFGAGAVTLNGTITLSISSASGFVREAIYTLALGTGTWSGAPTFVFDLPSGFSANTAYNGTGYNYDTVSKTLTVSVIPEPGTWALLGVGAVFLTVFRRRIHRA